MPVADHTLRAGSAALGCTRLGGDSPGATSQHRSTCSGTTMATLYPPEASATPKDPKKGSDQGTEWPSSPSAPRAGRCGAPPAQPWQRGTEAQGARRAAGTWPASQTHLAG